MAEPKNEVSALCMDCGLCCNGAIYDRAPLKPDEADDARATGFDVFELEDGPSFHLPCRHLCGAACTIYEQPRPHVCGDYFCRLAERLGAGEIDLAEARGRVAGAHQVIDQLQPHLREGEHLTAARTRWKSLRPGTMRPDEARFAMLMGALNRQIDRFFRYDSQVLMRPRSDADAAEDSGPKDSGATSA
jgi:hypothetical protein